MIITCELISGFSFGIEHVSKRDIEVGEGYYIIIDLGIIRLLLDYEPLE